MIKRNVVLFYSLAKNAFLSLSVFRVNFFASILTDVVLLVFSLLLWRALYQTGVNTPVQPFQQVVTYLLLARVAVPIDMGFVNTVQNRVLSGEIVAELLKPIKYSNYLLAQEIGFYLTQLLTRSLPIIIVVFLIYDIKLPSPPYLVLFFAALILSYLIIFYINFITAVAAFWIIHLFSLNVVKGQIIRFLSGSFVPLWFFPSGFQDIMIYLPFASIIYVPVQIYLENETIFNSIMYILLQGFWVVFILLVSKWVWNKATSELVINGG